MNEIYSSQPEPYGQCGTFCTKSSGSRAMVKSVVNIKIVDLKYRRIVYDDTAQFMEPVSGLGIFKSEKDEISEIKAECLKNALLNSIDRTREFFTKLFGGH